MTSLCVRDSWRIFFSKFQVTKDPSRAVPGCDVIIFVVPAFAHQGYMEALKPHIKPGSVVVGLPGQAGFEFAVRGTWGDLSREVTIMSFETLPWATRIKEFGRSVEVQGTKRTLLGALQPGRSPPTEDPTGLLQGIIGPEPKLTVKGHLLALTLLCYNVHPVIMYGRWHDWDGRPLTKAPEFYNGLDESTAAMLSADSKEILAIAKAITSKYPTVDLSNLCHVYDWCQRCYPDDIEDHTTLYTSIRTNKAYRGLLHPMITDDNGQFQPNFRYRYLSEDIPYGLTVLRGLAEVMGVAIPTMDIVLEWAQRVMGKEYLVEGQLKGKDVCETRAPQRYGLTTADKLINMNS